MSYLPMPIDLLLNNVDDFVSRTIVNGEPIEQVYADITGDTNSTQSQIRHVVGNLRLTKEYIACQTKIIDNFSKERMNKAQTTGIAIMNQANRTLEILNTMLERAVEEDNPKLLASVIKAQNDTIRTIGAVLKPVSQSAPIQLKQSYDDVNKDLID